MLETAQVSGHLRLNASQVVACVRAVLYGLGHTRCYTGDAQSRRDVRFGGRFPRCAFLPCAWPAARRLIVANEGTGLRPGRESANLRAWTDQVRCGRAVREAVA